MRYLLLVIIVIVTIWGCGIIHSPVECQDAIKKIAWTATGDDGDIGQAHHYEMRRSSVPIDESNWSSCELVGSMPAPSMAGTTDMVEISVSPNETVFLRIIACDEAGNCSALSNQVEIDFFPPDAIADLRVLD